MGDFLTHGEEAPGLEKALCSLRSEVGAGAPGVMGSRSHARVKPACMRMTCKIGVGSLSSGQRVGLRGLGATCAAFALRRASELTGGRCFGEFGFSFLKVTIPRGWGWR